MCRVSADRVEYEKGKDIRIHICARGLDVVCELYGSPCASLSVLREEQQQGSLGTMGGLQEHHIFWDTWPASWRVRVMVECA